MKLPPHIILEVTTRCNYRCPFCYCVWHEFPALSRPALDTAGWRSVIEECAEKGVKSLLFTGGEALLRKDIRDLLDYARDMLPEGDLSLFTNGSRLSDEVLRYLKRRRIRIATSLQGLRTYGEMTGTHRGYRPLLRTIARASELRWPLSVSITVNKVNLSEAADMFIAAALSHPASIQIGAMMAEGRGRSHPELMLTPAEWSSFKQQIRELPNCGVSYSFCDEFYCHCRKYPAEWRTRFGWNVKPCAAGRDFGVIGPDGKFRKCLHTVEEMNWRERPVDVRRIPKR